MDELIKNLSLLAKAAAMYLDAKRDNLAIQPLSDAVMKAADEAIVAEAVKVAPKQTKAVKPEPVAAKPEPVAAKPEPVAAKPEPVAAKPEPVAGDLVLDYDVDVAPVLRAAATRNRESVLAALGKYGAASGKDLKPEVYALFLKDIANV